VSISGGRSREVAPASASEELVGVHGVKPHILAAVSLSWVLACHHAGSADLWGRVLARGGELAEVTVDMTKVTVAESTVTLWGVIEVPDGSRMQAAYAGVDAVARSELLKLIRVRIADVMVSVESTEPARRVALEHTFEAVSGVIRHAGIPQHGWERVQRGDQVVLRVWARLSIPKADLKSALEAAHTAGDVELPARIIEGLESTPPTGESSSL
jgi:hypothetical protein